MTHKATGYWPKTTDWHKLAIEQQAEIERLRTAQLTDAERDRLRQWYNALSDLDWNWLDETDKHLLRKILNEQVTPAGARLDCRLCGQTYGFDEKHICKNEQ